ncbi:hypothetical protein [Leptolyngbya ohadii]|uniref:hypothetical protein n=1 Tax=Leptolyngbya ohadii TaxID=1962290 RepID=UPI000B598A53|nr:hypothetical protein [Leptolyngbya ohadii]
MPQGLLIRTQLCPDLALPGLSFTGTEEYGYLHYCQILGIAYNQSRVTLPELLQISKFWETRAG